MELKDIAFVGRVLAGDEEKIKKDYAGKNSIPFFEYHQQIVIYSVFLDTNLWVELVCLYYHTIYSS